MGYLSYGYKASKTPIGKKVVETVKNIFKGKKQTTTGTGAINKVEPNVPDTKLKKATSNLALATQKSKASKAKLNQTLFESKNKAFKGNDFTFSYSKKKTPKVSEQKAEGGRIGYKRGTGLMKKKSNVDKIKETFATKKDTQSKMTKKKKKFPDLTGDGKVTFADVLKGRGVINGKNKKKRFV